MFTQYLTESQLPLEPRTLGTTFALAIFMPLNKITLLKLGTRFALAYVMPLVLDLLPTICGTHNAT